MINDIDIDRWNHWNLGNYVIQIHHWICINMLFSVKVKFIHNNDTMI